MIQQLFRLVAVIGCTLIVNTGNAQIPIADIIKEGIKKVIKATDLMVQRIQNKTIYLQNVQRALENEMSKLKLNEIKDWATKQKDLYANYFDELWKVKNLLANYNKVRQIIQAQGNILLEYHTAYTKACQDHHFTAGELSYMLRVYTGILDASLQTLEQISMVVNGFHTQMSDGKRLELINTTALEMDAHLSALRKFNQQNIQVSIQRALEQKDVDAVRKLHGLN